MLKQISLAEVPRIKVEEAKRLADSRDVLFVDVRKPDYFARIRIEGALSIPLRGPAARYWELPTDRDIIVY